ncbi:MAG TPA: hypothetical protein PL088_15975 [Spirochaetota bacterium]|nr:hypothetical protein [Spirochaetota bacterium]
MTYRGIVKGNTIVIDPHVKLRDDTEVEITPIELKDPIHGIWTDDRSAEDTIREIGSS